MGFWDFLSDGINEIAPTMKRAGDAAYHRTADAVNKLNQVIRVEEGIQKLPDEERRALINLYTSTFAKIAVKEGIKHLPGATMTSKIIMDTISEVNQESHKDGIKEKEDGLKEELRSSTPQPPDKLSQNEKAKDVINEFMKTEFIGTHMFRGLLVSKISRMEEKSK